MTFNIDQFVSEIPPHTAIENIWQLATLEAWRQSFNETLNLTNEMSIYDVVGWMIANDASINQKLIEILSDDNISASQLSRMKKKIEKIFDPSKEICEILEKIKSLADDRGLQILDLITEARAGTSAISLFQKNATKQGIHEPLCVALINKLTPENVRALRLKGDDQSTKSLSIRFDDKGNVCVNQAGRGDRYSKDADIAVILTKNKETSVYLCSHKFARVAGGHQDNQLKDSSKYLRFALLSKVKDIEELSDFAKLTSSNYKIVPTLILDGEYFKHQIPQLQKEFEGELDRVLISDTQTFISKVS